MEINIRLSNVCRRILYGKYANELSKSQRRTTWEQSINPQHFPFVSFHTPMSVESKHVDWNHITLVYTYIRVTLRLLTGRFRVAIFVSGIRFQIVMVWEFRIYLSGFVMGNTAYYANRQLFNPLNPELNPICYLLALLGAHHFLHVSRIRVKLLTFRLLMSYIYGAPIRDVSGSHKTTQHSR